jgi:hypothetical protein
VVGVVDRTGTAAAAKELLERRLALDQGQRREVEPIEVKKVEGEVDQIARVAFRQAILQGGEARDAVGPKDRDLAVQISGIDRQ